LRAFFIYSRKDKAIRDDLEKHLSPLRQANRLECFYDGMILAGEKWEPRILRDLRRAHLILLLVSADSLSSKYCEKELTLAIARHESGKTRIIPILVRAVDLQATLVADFNVLPRSGTPISHAPNRDDVLSEVAKEIRKALDAFTASASRPSRKSPAPPPSEVPAPEAKYLLQQTLDGSELSRVARKIKLLHPADQQWLMSELVRQARGRSAPDVVEVFGAACEFFEPEALANMVNELVRRIAIAENPQLKALLLDAVPARYLRKATREIRDEFFSEVIGIIFGDQYDDVNSITAPLVKAQEAIPKKLQPDYVLALLAQADSKSFSGSLAARAGLKDLPEEIARSGLSKLDTSYLCSHGNKKHVRDFVARHRELAAPSRKALLRDYLAMSFREFRIKYDD
jgi:hypothetical protein